MNYSAPVLMPMPRSVSYTEGALQLACCGLPRFYLNIESNDHPVFQQAASVLREALTGAGCLLPAAGETAVTLSIDPACPALEGHAVEDAYVLDVSESGVRLTGFDAGGAYYAVQTFIQLLTAQNGHVSAPFVSIVDWPSFKTRGLFLEDRYGSDFLSKEDWFAAIDYFSRMKMNSLTIGIYGCWCQQFDGMISEFLYVPFQKYPQLQTPRHVKYYSVKERKWVYRENVLPTMFEEDFFGELIAYAKKRNITVKPLFNSYGHNTLIPRLLPELSAKDEDGNPTGFGVCTADDRTYEIMNSLYDEIIDRYLAPNGIDAIQIGLDEVWDGIGMDAVDPFKYHTPFCRCETCRAKERSELMLEYIIRLCHHLKDKGMKSVYIYQDMLQHEFDVLHEPLVERLKQEGLYDTVVIDWWNYMHEDQLFHGHEVNSLFRSIIKSFTGYYHWSTPMEYLSNIRGCARYAEKYGFEGMEAYSSMEYSHDRSYRYVSELAWNIDTLDDQAGFLARYADFTFPGADALPYLAKMGEIMDALNQDGAFTSKELYALDYYAYSYVKAGQPYPRRFPEEVFERIHENPERWQAGFEALYDAACEAVEYFGSLITDCNNYSMASVWYATALHIQVVSGEYLGLMALEGETDAEQAAETLKTLLFCRENLMFVSEDTRAAGNSFMYLRIQSIYRQILADLLAYAEKCAAEGAEFHVDMTDLSGVTGSMLRALR